MDTIFETKNLNDPLVKVHAHDQKILEGTDRPRPEWVRGVCPQCGDELVGNCYYVAGKVYLALHECWSSLGERPTCGYRKVL